MNKNRILHIMMESPFLEGMGYQENILTRKHKQLGFRVFVVSCKGKLQIPESDMVYTNQDNVSVEYLENNQSALRKIPFIVGWTRSVIGLKDAIERISPDVIFIHGICKYDNIDVIRYCRHNPHVRLYADNHSDYYNTPVKTIKQKSFRYGVGRYIGSKLNKYASKIWGVTPWRVDYMRAVYGIKDYKSDLLIMGGDESFINWEKRKETRQTIRSRINVPEDAFVVITGGKIDMAKNVHMLVDAVKNTNKKLKVFLLLIGTFEEKIEEYCMQGDISQIRNIGWLKPSEIYEYCLASDLACFPGTHSVLWEQVCACGLPAIFKDWQGGVSHLDVGGNCILLKKVNTEEIRKNIENILLSPELYNKMYEIASTKARDTFSYINIAKKSIEYESNFQSSNEQY